MAVCFQTEQGNGREEDFEQALETIALVVPPDILSLILSRVVDIFGLNAETKCIVVTNAAVEYIKILIHELKQVKARNAHYRRSLN